MGSVIGTIFAFTLVFGILVFVHEFGHFFMAKLVGIKVEVFSFGYGKRLFGFKKGETDYRVSIIPMGGYVRFTGEEVYEEKREIMPGDFMASKRWQRFLVMFMGAFMNIVLALILMTVVNMKGVEVPAIQYEKPVIGWIESGSPADAAGLQVGDEILRISGKETATWNDVEMAIGSRPERTLPLEIKRGDEIIDVDLTTESITRYAFGYAGFFGRIRPQIKMVLANSPAEKAGVMAGDVVLAVDGSDVTRFDFEDILKKSGGKELDWLVDRNGEQLHLKVTPEIEGNVGKVGISHSQKILLEKYGILGSLAESFRYNTRLIFLVFNTIRDLATGEASAKQISGPIEIANFSYAVFRMGFIAMLGWIAFISLQLGVINLLPIPVMDGGQILVLALEGLFRRDFSLKVKQVIMQIGFVIFIVLIVFVILNDVAKRLPNGWASLWPF